MTPTHAQFPAGENDTGRTTQMPDSTMLFVRMSEGPLKIRDTTLTSALTHAGVVATPVDIDALEVFVQTPTAGAVVQFIGRVRDHDHDRPVTSLKYEAHPHASHTLLELTNKIAGQYSGMGELPVTANALSDAQCRQHNSRPAGRPSDAEHR
ncbi:MAG: molybdenum cofactor biosynthesis protein MoaE [Actinomycetota bacterium]|nr:molybdenum cofactor biosynthesis protein MoaE [Actinomycetota bacterium]